MGKVTNIIATISLLFAFDVLAHAETNFVKTAMASTSPEPVPLPTPPRVRLALHEGISVSEYHRKRRDLLIVTNKEDCSKFTKATIWQYVLNRLPQGRSCRQLNTILILNFFSRGVAPLPPGLSSSTVSSGSNKAP